MNRVAPLVAVLSALTLLGCTPLTVSPKELAEAEVVRVHHLPGIEVNAVAGTDYFRALQGAIERQDRDRMLSAGFTPEQAAQLLDPAQSAGFLAPYQEAARGRDLAVRAGELCRVWISAGVYRVKPERPAEVCAKL